jgi:hypothetical protein
LWNWYNEGGDRHVAAYLDAYDRSGFDPKAPPPKTKAFWDIVDASRAPEDAELADVIDALKSDKHKSPDNKLLPPLAFPLSAVQEKADVLALKDLTGKPERNTFAHWLADRKNRRQIPYRFEQCGYVPIRNRAAKDGLWVINGRRVVIYGLADLSLRNQLAAAKKVVDDGGGKPGDVGEIGVVNDPEFCSFRPMEIILVPAVNGCSSLR